MDNQGLQNTGVPAFGANPVATPPQQPATQPQTQPEPFRPQPPKRRRLNVPYRWLAVIIVLLLLGIGGVAYYFATRPQGESSSSVQSSTTDPSSRFDVLQLPLGDLGTQQALQGAKVLSINGRLEVNDSFLLAPAPQPTEPTAGQIYFDEDTNVLAYFNGTEFIEVTEQEEQTVVQSVGGISGEIAVGTGISTAGGLLTNEGVLTVLGAGPLSSTGGQSPTLTFANGTANGQVWQWNGSSWELATLPSSTPSADNVVGNEVTDVIVGGGLIVRGSATAVDPLRLGMQECSLDEVLKSNGAGGWACAADAGGASYTAGNGLQLTGSQFSVNSPTCAGTDKLRWTGSAFACAADNNTTYTAGTGMSLVGTTFNNTGVLSVAGSGPITSTGGQNPSLTFAVGTVAGQIWQWDGDSWELVALPGEQDAVIGNEVVGGTGSNSGLVRSGAGTAGDPYTLQVNTGNGLQISSNAVGINSPTCAGTDKLQWNGTAFVCATDTDTNTTYSTIANGGLRLVGTQFGLAVCGVNEVLKATAVSGEYACAADNNTTYTADGQGIELTGTTFGLELNGATLSKSASGLSVNLGNANTWSAAQTFGAGATVTTGQALTVNGEAFTDLTGTGLVFSAGTLQTSLGTSVDLGSEVVGTLPVANGGTGLTSIGTANQLLGVNATGTALEYKNLASLVSAGSGINITGTNSITVANTGVLDVTGSGAITSTGGQNPDLSFVDGSAAGQVWRWDGDSWELATLSSSEGDGVIGNEVTNVITNGGLTRAGTGSAVDPYLLGLQSCPTNQILKSSSPGVWACASDGGDGDTTYTADGEGIILTGTVFSLDLDGASLSKSINGLQLNTANANTWSAAQTFGAGLAISAAQAITINGDAVTDLTGTGLTVSSGALQATLGTSVDLTSEVTGILPITNGGTGLSSLGTAHQLLGVNAAGTALEYKNIATLVSAGSGISVSGTNNATITNTGVLDVTGSGPITSSGGQNPDVTFADGSATGQLWQWDGDSWELVTLSAAEGDPVVGNEITNVTGGNSGLVRSGAGTTGDPYTVAANVGDGLQIATNAITINSPTCAGTDKLQWTGTAFVCAADTDTNTTYSTIANGGLRLVGTQFGLSVCAQNEILKATAVSGEYACAADANTTYTADGQGIELSGTTFSLELNGASLSKGTSGLSLNVANANTWSAAQTFGAGVVVSAGQSLTLNGEAFTDLTGTGLTFSAGSLQTTLGTSVDLGSEVVGTLPTANGGTGLSSIGTAHQLLGVNAAGTALEYKNIASLIGAGAGINITGTNTATITNTGVLDVTGSGPITSSGGQNPDLTFAVGTVTGQIWQWDGDGWELASLPAEQDAVIGNEVVGGTGSNSGLVRSGTGTGGNPYTLEINTGNGLQIATNELGIDSPTCSGTDKLQWTGTAFVCAADSDSDTTYSTITNGGLRLVGTQFGLAVCSTNQILKATAVSGEYACAADNNTTYTADGQGIELTGTTFGLELNGATLSKSASGLSVNLGNANTWSAAQTFGAGATVTAGQALTVNGEAFTDLTGTGLVFNAGALQTTLGTTVDLGSEVTGTLPTANGGTGLTSIGTANQLLGVNGAGTGLEYKNISSLLAAGTGINLSGTSTVTINNSGVLTVAASGALQSSGGQNPTITFLDGSSNGQFWQWDGDSWELSSDIGTAVNCNVAGNFACIGGNTLAGTVTLGSNNAQSVVIETNNTAAMTINSSGAATFQAATNSASAFQVQNAAANNVLLVDTTTTNLVTNPSFETNTTGWSALAGNTAGNPAMTRVTTQAIYGSASLQVTTNADTNEGVRYPVTLSPSTQYTLTFYTKASGGNITTLQIGRLDTGTTETNCLTGQTAVTTGWSKHSCTFTTGASISGSYIYIKQGDAAAHSWFVDGVMLEAASTNAQYAEGKVSFIGGVGINTTPGTNGSGLTVRGTGENGLNNRWLFAVQDLNGNNRIEFNEQYNRTLINGGSGFWNSAALEVKALESSAVSLRVDQVTGQTSNTFEVRSAAGGTPVRYAVGAGDYTDTSGSKSFNLIAPNFNPTASSTASFTAMAITPTINFAGGGAGNTTALLVNPTYTAAPSGTNLLADFQNGGVSVFALHRTGTIVGKTTTDSTSAFNFLDSTNASVFNIDTLNNRVGINDSTPETDLDVNGVIQQTGIRTPDTNGVDGNEWTRLGTCSIDAQYEHCFTVLNLAGGYDGGASSNTQATISARVKQQDALGAAPLNNLTLNGTSQVLTKDDFKLVTTQNNGAGTVVELWVRVTLSFERLNFAPTVNLYGGTKWAWTPETAYQPALPAGTQTAAIYGDTYANTLTVQPAVNDTEALLIDAVNGNDILRVDSVSERVAIGVIGGTPSAKLNVATASTVGTRIFQGGTDDILQLANSTANVFVVDDTGAVASQNTTNSTSAFTVLNAASTQMFTIDTTNGRVAIGRASGGTGAGAKLTFGDYGTGIGNLFIGESGTTDTDILEVHGLSGISFTTTDTADTERMFIDTDGVHVYGGGSTQSAGRLFFGDSDFAWVGERGTSDTDALALYGDNGIDFVVGSSNITKATIDDVGSLIVSNDVDAPTKQYRMRTSGGSLDFEAGGANLYISAWSNADFTGTQQPALILYSGQSRFDVNAGYTYFNPTSDSTSTIDVGTPGTGLQNLIRFVQSGTVQGSITVNGTTVAYNAFTGTHYAWTDEPIERGTVVSMTGDNKKRDPNDPNSEPFYGIKKTTQANDPAVLGSYFGIGEGSFSFDNPHQVMSVGNGDMWVSDEGGDIQPGDLLISASTAGHAMKDNGQFATSYVIARASEKVEWSGETQMINGHKHKRISVLFETFTQLNGEALRQGLWNGGIVTEDATFKALVKFEGEVEFKNNVTFSNNAAGEVVIPAGQREVNVRFSRAHRHIPVVNATPKEFLTGNYRIKDITADSFTIELSETQGQDATFNWTAVTTE